MKLARVLFQGRHRVVAVLPDGGFVDLAALEGIHQTSEILPLLEDKTLSSLNVVLKAAHESGSVANHTLPADTPLLPPLPRPNRILAIGRNYAEHAKELGNAVPEDPIVFLKASSCVVGPNADIELPAWVGRVDYEAELLVVIGKGGKNISEAEAMTHVVGYSVFNDITARDKQRAAQEKKHPWFLAKSLDTSGPLGPYVVTPDEVPDPHDLRISLTVNGQIKQDDTTASMMHSIPRLIAYLSHWIALEPGDVIATGTPSGVGPLTPGDVVEATVEGVGTLRNTVVSVS